MAPLPLHSLMHLSGGAPSLLLPLLSGSADDQPCLAAVEGLDPSPALP